MARIASCRGVRGNARPKPSATRSNRIRPPALDKRAASASLPSNSELGIGRYASGFVATLHFVLDIALARSDSEHGTGRKTSSAELRPHDFVGTAIAR